MEDLIKKAVQTASLDEREIVALLSDASCGDALRAAADGVRASTVGPGVHLRGLIEFTNVCRHNCAYCGLRLGNKDLKRYRLSAETIIRAAETAAERGIKTIVLQGGEDMFFTPARLAPIIDKLKSMGLAVTLGLGELSRNDYRALKEAGVDRYLLRIETTDPALYSQLNPGMSLESRMRCLDDLNELDFETGSGIMTGLPGQSLRSIARDLLYFKRLDFDMIGIGPFIPHPCTPLRGAAAGDLGLALRVTALARLLMPGINIPATTAMESLSPGGRMMALSSGANVVMPNITPSEGRPFYEIYPGKAGSSDDPLEYLDTLIADIRNSGRTISEGIGSRRKG